MTGNQADLGEIAKRLASALFLLCIIVTIRLLYLTKSFRSLIRPATGLPTSVPHDASISLCHQYAQSQTYFHRGSL